MEGGKLLVLLKGGRQTVNCSFATGKRCADFDGRNLSSGKEQTIGQLAPFPQVYSNPPSIRSKLIIYIRSGKTTSGPSPVDILKQHYSQCLLWTYNWFRLIAHKILEIHEQVAFEQCLIVFVNVLTPTRRLPVVSSY